MNCVDCAFHKIISDPDPVDWFCDDDMAIICTKTKKPPEEVMSDSKYASDRQDFRTISVSCRPHRIRDESRTPHWCPLGLGK